MWFSLRTGEQRGAEYSRPRLRAGRRGANIILHHHWLSASGAIIHSIFQGRCVQGSHRRIREVRRGSTQGRATTSLQITNAAQVRLDRIGQWRIINPEGRSRPIPILREIARRRDVLIGGEASWAPGSLRLPKLHHHILVGRLGPNGVGGRDCHVGGGTAARAKAHRGALRGKRFPPDCPYAQLCCPTLRHNTGPSAPHIPKATSPDWFAETERPSCASDEAAPGKPTCR